MTARAAGPGFWATVFMLLGAARKRTSGRIRRHIKLRYRRGGRTAAIWPVIGIIFGALLAAALHIGAAFDIMLATTTAERVQAEMKGRIVVEVGRLPTNGRGPHPFPRTASQITPSPSRRLVLKRSRPMPTKGPFWVSRSARQRTIPPEYV